MVHPATPAAPYAVPVFRVELVRERELVAPTVRSPHDVGPLLCEYLARADREHFVLVMLATSGRIIGLHTVHIGTLNASLVHVPDVFKAAILANAAAVIVAHNHPSGNLEPSAADVQITRQLVEAGKLLAIPVHDHLIIGHGSYVSLCERGLL